VELSAKEKDRLLGMLRRVPRDQWRLSVEKARLITESYKMSEGEPEVIRQAKAMVHVLRGIPIWIDADERIVGHGASAPGAIEIDPFLGPINLAYLKEMQEEGLVVIEDTDWPLIEEIADYWRQKNWQTRTWRLADRTLREFLKVGIWLPPIEDFEEGIGAYAGTGLGLYHGLHLGVLKYEKVLSKGLLSMVEEIKEKLEELRFDSTQAIEKRLFYEAAIIILEGILEFAKRFSQLARAKALDASNGRREELLKIAEICEKVPAKPATGFWEALQAFWFTYLMCNPSPTIGMGRFDQYMYPFYRYSIEVKECTKEDVLSLLCELRIKDMELVRLALRPVKRMQHTGQAKWHNMVIGGTDKNGNDATNELTYLVLDAAKILRTPHHTVTLRVHERTPKALLTKALEVVRTGVGMPALVSDSSYERFLVSKGVPVTEARDYALGGCLDVALPGQLRIVEANFFVVPKVLEVFLNGGKDPRTGLEVGPFRIELKELRTYNTFVRYFKQYLKHFIQLWSCATNLQAYTKKDIMKHVFEALLMENGIEEGRGFYELRLPYKLNSVLLPVGVINVVDSLAAVKKLVYEEKKISLLRLKEALDANWEGAYDIRKMCLEAPKYGNDDDYVDSIASELYSFLAKTVGSFRSVLGGRHGLGGVSIASMWLGGAITGATPDGRYAGEVLADGSMSPMRGRDKCGPTAVLKSASKIDQSKFASTLLNMKFHPSSLKSEDDLKKLADLIMVYFSMGGKHIQFNVIDKKTLIEAQVHPEEYRDLIVRVAGYSAYFVQLGKAVQDEIIQRTEHCL